MNFHLFFTSLFDHILLYIRTQYFAYLFVYLLWLLPIRIRILFPIVTYIRITNFFISWLIFDIDRAQIITSHHCTIFAYVIQFRTNFATFIFLYIFLPFWINYFIILVIIIIIFAWWLERRLPRPGWFKPLFYRYST